MPRSHSVIVALAGSALFATSACAQAPGREGGRPDRAGQAEAFADRIMASDVNKDGKLALDEMDSQYGQTMMDRADANKDGFLTRDELIAMAQQRISGRRPGQPEGEQGEEHGEEESFHEGMEQAGRGLSGFRRSPMDDSSREADLKSVRSLQLGLFMAKSHVDDIEMSEASKESFGDNKAAHHAAMHLTLIKMIITTLEFEHALVEGKTEKAKKVFGSIRSLRAEAHDLFESEEDHDDEDPAPRRPDRGGRGKGGGGEG